MLKIDYLSAASSFFSFLEITSFSKKTSEGAVSHNCYTINSSPLIVTKVSNLLFIGYILSNNQTCLMQNVLFLRTQGIEHTHPHYSDKLTALNFDSLFFYYTKGPDLLYSALLPRPKSFALPHFEITQEHNTCSGKCFLRLLLPLLLVLLCLLLLLLLLLLLVCLNYLFVFF